MPYKILGLDVDATAVNDEDRILNTGGKFIDCSTMRCSRTFSLMQRTQKACQVLLG